MAGIEQANGLLSSEAESRLAFTQEALQIITEARDAPEYVGGLLVASRTLPRLIIENTGHYVLTHAQALPDVWGSQENHAAFLSDHAYQALRQDVQHGIYLRLAELVSGAATTYGDEWRARHGLELGSRIVTQRAHRTAYYLADSAKAAQEFIALYDEPAGGTLLHRASKAYGKNGISPLHTTPKAEGRRFQFLIDKIKNNDYSGTEDRLAITNTSPHLLRRFGQAFKWTRPIIKLSRVAGKTETVDLALEEAFDTFYPKWDLKIKDDDVLFIARFALKVNRLLEGAARRDPEIAAEPRPKHLSVLSNGLQNWNIPKQLMLFEEGVRIACEREPR